jgi:hypothetical protein
MTIASACGHARPTGLRAPASPFNALSCRRALPGPTTVFAIRRAGSPLHLSSGVERVDRLYLEIAGPEIAGDDAV